VESVRSKSEYDFDALKTPVGVSRVGCFTSTYSWMFNRRPKIAVVIVNDPDFLEILFERTFPDSRMTRFRSLNDIIVAVCEKVDQLQLFSVPDQPIDGSLDTRFFDHLLQFPFRLHGPVFPCTESIVLVSNCSHCIDVSAFHDRNLNLHAQNLCTVQSWPILNI
jgi:hypothetical protein